MYSDKWLLNNKNNHVYFVAKYTSETVNFFIQMRSWFETFGM